MITVLIAEDEMKWKGILEKVLSQAGYSLRDVDNTIKVIREEADEDPLFLKQLTVKIEKLFFTGEQGSIYKSILETVERPLIEAALQRTDGNQLKAAQILGINRNTIRTKIKKLGINVIRCKKI